MIARRAAIAADRRGSTTVLVAGALPMLLALVALAVDVGMVQLESRRLQGIADTGAIAAAQDIAAAHARATAFVARRTGDQPITTTTVAGTYVADPAIAAANRFTAGGATPDAVRVTLSTQVRTPFAAVFGTPSVRVARTATASRLDLASLSVGSRLASLNGGVANALLSALTGGTVSLSLLDYNALASAQVDLFPFLDAVRTRAGVQAGTYNQLLATQVSGNTLLHAAADQVADASASAALRALATAAQGTTTLNRLLELGPLGSQTSGGAGLVRIDALDLATNLIQSSAPNRQVQLDLGASIPGLASTRATVAIGERPNQSPWIAIGRGGDVVVRTAQARIYVESRLASTPLPGLPSTAVELPLFVELASAEARLDALRCADPRQVDVRARPSPGLAALARVDRDLLDDFTAPLARQPAQLLRVPLLLKVEGSATVDLGAAEPYRALTFTAAQIAAGTPQTIGSTTLVSSLASSLLTNASIDAQLLGFLPIPLDPIETAVAGALGLVAPAVDQVLATTMKTLGVGLGEADVRVTGLRCGQPVLVA